MSEEVLPVRAAMARSALLALPSALVLASLVLGACSDSSGTDSSGPPASMEVVDGDGQRGTVGEELDEPLVVRVMDDRDRPVRGQLVNWRVTAGGGSVFAGSAITDRDGIVRERWTLGTTAGAEQRVEARAVDNSSGAALVFATFDAKADAGPATALTAAAGTGQSGAAGAALPQQVVVRATDTYGNGVPDLSITWEVVAGGGQVSPASSTTDDDGEASTTWMLGAAAGAQQLSARSGTLAPATFGATARAGAPARLEIISGNEREGIAGAALSEPVVVRVLDALGNAVPGVAVAWSAQGGGTVTPSSTTDDAGLASATWTLGTAAGSQSASASATGATGATFTARALAGPPAAIAIASGNDQQATVGTQLPNPLVVRVTDQYANATPDVAVAWAIAAGGGSVTAVDASTDDDGRASARWVIGAAGSSNRVTATAAPGVVATFRGTGLTGGAGRLINHGATPSGTAEVYSRNEMRVQLVDAAGQPVAGATVTWTPSGGGFVQPATSTTDAYGYATSTWRLSKQPGENGLAISALDVAPLTFAMTARTGEACNAGIQYPSSPGSPPSGPVGSVLPNEAIAFAYDFFGNPVAGYSFGSGARYPADYGQQLIGGPLTTDATGRSAPAYLKLGTTPGEQGFLFGSLARICQGNEDAHYYRNQHTSIMGYATPAP